MRWWYLDWFEIGIVVLIVLALVVGIYMMVEEQATCERAGGEYEQMGGVWTVIPAGKTVVPTYFPTYECKGDEKK